MTSLTRTGLLLVLLQAWFALALAQAESVVEPSADELPLELDLGELEVAGDAVDIEPASSDPSVAPVSLSSGAVTVITREQLATAGSVAEVLDRLPGVDIKYSGGTGQLATAQLRGARASQVAVLLDGMPLPALGVPDLALLPLGGVDRVEVQRGPAGSLHGSGALGGAINIVTTPTPVAGSYSSPTTHPATWRSPLQIQESASLTVGSHGLASFGWSRFGNGADWHFSHLRSRNNYAFKRSGGATARRQNNAAEITQLWTSWHDEDWDWRAGLLRLERGVPGSAEFPTLEAELRQGAVWLQAQRQGQQAGLSWTGARFRDPQPYLNTGPLASNDQRWHFDYARGRLAQDADARWGWRLRADTASGDAAGDTTRLRTGLDLTHAWQGESGRYGWQAELGTVASSDAGLDPVASLSLSHRHNTGFGTYASAAYSVRHPDFAELYLPNMGGVRGNPGLLPERAWSTELGLNYATQRSTLQAAAFWTQYADSILFMPVSAYAVEARNTGAASVAGLEAAWRRELGRGWSWESGGTWLPLAELDSGVPLAQRSPLRLNAGLAFAADDWRGALRASYASRTPLDMFGNLRAAPRTLLDFEAGKKIDAGELSLAVLNLTGEDARDSWNYPLPGREITLTWRSEL